MCFASLKLHQGLITVKCEMTPVEIKTKIIDGRIDLSISHNNNNIFVQIFILTPEAEFLLKTTTIQAGVKKHCRAVHNAFP